jgi:hypothetical protein
MSCGYLTTSAYQFAPGRQRALKAHSVLCCCGLLPLLCTVLLLHGRLPILQAGGMLQGDKAWMQQ